MRKKLLLILLLAIVALGMASAYGTATSPCSSTAAGNEGILVSAMQASLDNGDTNRRCDTIIIHDTVCLDSMIPHQLILLSNDTLLGTCAGGGSYFLGSIAQIMAIPLNGAQFDHWSDGVTDNLRSIVMDTGKALMAFFSDPAANDTASQASETLHGPIEYLVSADGKTLSIGFGYGNKKLRVNIGEGGENGLCDFRSVHSYDRDATLLTATSFSSLISKVGDMHAPWRIKTTNDSIIGDTPNGHYFTGGGHSRTSNGQTVRTAASEYVRFYADGLRLQNDAHGSATNVRIVWSNLVQGCNTFKYDGTGAPVLREMHVMDFDGVTFNETIDIEMLADCNVCLWYGLESEPGGTAHYPVLDSLQFLDGTNRTKLSVLDGTHNSANKTCSIIRLTGKKLCMEYGIDNTVDLGKREKSVTSRYGGKSATTGKTYFTIISSPTDQYTQPMTKGYLYRLKGWYRFIQVDE